MNDMVDRPAFTDQTFRALHEHLGLDTFDCIGRDGHVDSSTWGVKVAGRGAESVLLMLRGLWFALFTLFTNRLPEGTVLLVWRGRDPKDGGPRNPDVVMGYDVYVRLLAGLKREELANLEFGGDE